VIDTAERPAAARRLAAHHLSPVAAAHDAGRDRHARRAGAGLAHGVRRAAPDARARSPLPRRHRRAPARPGARRGARGAREPLRPRPPAVAAARRVHARAPGRRGGARRALPRRPRSADPPGARRHLRPAPRDAVLLGALTDDPQDAFERLRALPFAELGREGLVIHDAVREAVATLQCATNPVTYRAYRTAAWRQIRAELPRGGWSSIADMIALAIEPLVREAFCTPSSTTPSRRRCPDWEAIAAITAAATRTCAPGRTRRTPSAWPAARAGPSSRSRSCARSRTCRPRCCSTAGAGTSTAHPVPRDQRVLVATARARARHGRRPFAVLLRRAARRRARVPLEERPPSAASTPSPGARRRSSRSATSRSTTRRWSAISAEESVAGWLSMLAAKDLDLEPTALADRELTLDGRRIAQARDRPAALPDQHRPDAQPRRAAARRLGPRSAGGRQRRGRGDPGLRASSASMPGVSPPSAASGSALRRGRRQREGQRLRVGAGPQRVGGADRLRERDRHGVVGHRAVPRRLRERHLQQHRQRERAVGRLPVGHRERRVGRGGDHVGGGGGRVVLGHARRGRSRTFAGRAERRPSVAGTEPPASPGTSVP